MKQAEDLPLQEGFIKDSMNGFEHFTKRAFDMVLAACCLVVFSPLFAYCYIIIRREDGGPAIYKQERIGLGGRPFQIYKFRTMHPNTETDTPLLADPNDDAHLTHVGKVLRARHLDELPQLWNVLIGDMAFVGPRPERKYFIDMILKEDPRYEYLYQIRPGVTSYATLYNGYTDTMDKMLRRLHYDLYYLQHRSFRFDCKVLWRTFRKIVMGDKF
jgi:lipopolysaccharide/colanic/teichoic acid biosynthesis glycosyltransferase